MLLILLFICFINAETIYIYLSSSSGIDAYVFGEIDKCVNYKEDEIKSIKLTKISNSKGAMIDYSQTNCQGESATEEGSALFEEPSAKYKMIYYEDEQCSYSLNLGILYPTNIENLPLNNINKCFIDEDGTYVTLKCGKGYTNKNGDCEKTGSDDVTTYGDQHGCESGLKTVDKKCTVNGVGESAKIYSCDKCKNGYSKDSVNVCDEEYDYCTLIPCSVSNCEYCSSNNICEKCYDGYSVSDGKCIEGGEQSNGKSILIAIISIILMILI